MTALCFLMSNCEFAGLQLDRYRHFVLINLICELGDIAVFIVVPRGLVGAWDGTAR